MALLRSLAAAVQQSVVPWLVSAVYSHHSLKLLLLLLPYAPQAMVVHVKHDHALLAERIARLTGAEGSARLAVALDHVRQQVAAEVAAAEAEAEAEAAEAAETSSDTSSAAGSPAR